MKKIYWSLLLIVGLYSFTGTKYSFPDNVLKKFRANSQLLYSEKLFLHFDRPLYFAGDEMWFQSYLMTAQNHLPETMERVLYVELINPSGAIVKKSMFKLNDGHCDGVLKLKNTLKTGNYAVVAYTNWMRNQGADFYFSQEIKILSSDVSVFPAADNVKPVLNSQLPYNSDSISKAILPSKQVEQLNLNFFPEGGDLVDGLYTKVGYVGHNQAGEGMSYYGVVVDNNNDTVAALNPIYKGQGFFFIKPEYGKKYRAIIDGFEEAQYDYSLPEVKQTGYRLGIANEWGRDSLYVFMNVHSSLPANAQVSLLSQQDGIIKGVYDAQFRDGAIVFKVAKKQFATGIVQFTLFDADYVPQCERLIYINQNDQLSIEVNGLDSLIGKREKVKLKLKVKDKLGQPVQGHFSMAITDGTQLPDEHYGAANIVNFLYLQSNLKGKIDDIDMLLMNNAYSHACLDMLMMINGWRRFTWEEMLLDSLATPAYLMEQGIFIDGVVRRRSSNKTVPKGIDISMLMFGHDNDAYWAETDDEGRFTFPIRDFYDTTKVVVQTKNRLNQKADFNIELSSNLRFEPSDFSARERMQAQQIALAIQFTSADLSEGDVHASKGGMKESIKRVMEEGFFRDTTDVMLGDIDVKAKVKKTSQQEMTEEYGAANQVVGQRQIEDLIKNTPWYYGLTSLLYDAIPGLQVMERQNFTAFREIDLFNSTLYADSVDIDEEDDFDMNTSGKVVEFRMKDRGPHRMYLYVDGEFVGVSDAYGILYFMREPYTVDDFINMDPKSVKSLELILSPKDSPMRDLMGDEVMAMEEMTGSEAILSIYTKDGSGIYARGNNKGIANFQLYGYVRKREFYSPQYDVDNDVDILEDKRTTLYWNPSIITDSLGKAKVSFYNSDVAQDMRIHIEGMSDSGLPGTYRQTMKVMAANTDIPSSKETPEKERLFEQDYAESPEISLNTELQLKQALFANGKPASYATICIRGKEWSTIANADGSFVFQKDVLMPGDTLELNVAGLASKVQMTDEINQEKAYVLINLTPKANQENAEKILKQMRRRLISNSSKKAIFARGVYRESIAKSNHLYQLRDFSFIQKREPYRTSVDAHRSMPLQGRDYRTEDYRMQVLYEPLTIIDDPVPVMDPLHLNVSFLGSDASKYYQFVNEGISDYIGKQVFRINFSPKPGVTKALHEGTMLIDASSYALMHVKWKLSEQSKIYEMPQMYLMPGKEISDFSVMKEHNEAFYHMINGQSQLRAVVQNVSLNVNSDIIQYSRELFMQSYFEKRPADFKPAGLNSKKSRRLLIQHVNYRPEFWRDDWVLPIKQSIKEQIKYLHEVTFYK
ncbi:hypothetical protein [Carboxylicivirga marina]|uniref:hypothetical protein n=1 Tax=Carboxylicivirga marina TaxID=2800988 RepID=UPI002595D82A|nr:hypothetical protein [uncultured Carboxylicivirga sp.]